MSFNNSQQNRKLRIVSTDPRLQKYWKVITNNFTEIAEETYWKGQRST